MANNTTANASTVAGGPTLAMYDISAGTPPTTGLASCAVIYAAATSSTQPTVSCEANPFFASITDGTNKMPTMDAAARKGFVLVTDGTNSCKLATPNAALAENAATWLETASLLCALDTGAGAGSQAVQCLVESTAAPNLRVGIYNGTAHMPAGDTAAHRIYTQHTDGTNATPSMDVAARKGFVSVTDGTNTMPTGDAIARSVYAKVGDGTTSIAVDTVSGGVKQAPVGGGTPLGVGGTVTASSNNQTLSATSGKITHATGFVLTGLGATAASNIAVTLSDGTWTLSFAVPIPAGATVPVTPFQVNFPVPLAASAANTTIVLTVPSYGSGNTTATATLFGFKV